jgi:hypothetical protein
MSDTNFREIGGRLPGTLPSTTVRVTELNRVFSSGAGTQAAERAGTPTGTQCVLRLLGHFLSAWERCVFFKVAVMPEAWSQSPACERASLGITRNCKGPASPGVGWAV